MAFLGTTEDIGHLSFEDSRSSQAYTSKRCKFRGSVGSLGTLQGAVPNSSDHDQQRAAKIVPMLLALSFKTQLVTLERISDLSTCKSGPA